MWCVNCGNTTITTDILWILNSGKGTFLHLFNCVFVYLARHVVAAHLEHLQLVLNLLEIFETPSSVFVQLGYAWNLVVYS